MSPKDFAARFHMRDAVGSVGCRSCVYSRMANALDAGINERKDGRLVSNRWVCNHPAAREPGREADGLPSPQSWEPYTKGANRLMRAGASNVVVSFHEGGDTICDAFAPLGPSDAPASAQGPIAEAAGRMLSAIGRSAP